MEDPSPLNMLERQSDKVSRVWVFKGTRVPVAAFFENLKDGASIDQFLEWFPGVSRAQVEALLASPDTGDPLIGLFSGSVDLATRSKEILEQEISSGSGFTWKES